MSGAEVSVTNTAAYTADMPQLLLEHHLKELRLLTSCVSTTRWRGSAPSSRWNINTTCCERLGENWTRWTVSVLAKMKGPQKQYQLEG